MADARNLAYEIRRKHPTLYGSNPDDTAVIDDFRKRASALGTDPTKLDAALGNLEGYEKKDGILPELGGLTTAMKSGLNSALLGAPEAAAQFFDTSLYNPGERERHPWADTAGSIGGSILGFGKIGALAKGARTGVAALKSMALADAVAGGVSSGLHEYASEKTTADTNATGKNEGNPYVGVPLAAATGAAFGAVPLARMRVLQGKMAEPGRAAKAALAIAPQVGGHIGGTAASIAAEVPSDQFADVLGASLSDPTSWILPGAFSYLGVKHARGPWEKPAGASATPAAQAARTPGVPTAGMPPAQTPTKTPPPAMTPAEIQAFKQ